MLLEVDAWVKARAAGITVPITINGVSTNTSLTVTWWNPEEHKRLMTDLRYCYLAIQPIGLRRDDPRSRPNGVNRLWRHKPLSLNKLAQKQRYPQAVRAQYQIALYAAKPRHARTLYPQLLAAFPDVDADRIAVDLFRDGTTQLVPINLIRDDDIRETFPLEAERHIQAVIMLDVRTWIFYRTIAQLNTFWNTFEVQFNAEHLSGLVDTTEDFSVVL